MKKPMTTIEVWFRNGMRVGIKSSLSIDEANLAASAAIADDHDQSGPTSFEIPGVGTEKHFLSFKDILYICIQESSFQSS